MNKIKVTTIVCLFLILLFTLSLSAEDDLQNLIEGIKSYYQGDYETALTELNKSIVEENINQEIKVNILYYRALAQIELNNIPEAKNTINILRNRGYEFGYLHQKMGELYLNKDKQFDMPFFNEAKKQLEKAVELGINSIALHKDLATAYEGLDNTDKAIEEYEFIMKLDESEVNYLNLASLYSKKGNIEKAIKYYNREIKNGNENAFLYLNLGELHLKNNNYKMAIEVLEKGITFNRELPALYYKLGRAYYLNKDFADAKNIFSRVINLKENYYQAYFHLGQIFRQEENWQEAIYNFEQAIKYNPDYADAYISLGCILLEQENYYKAISNFTLAIEKNETYPEGHYHLARAYLKLNMQEAAVQELRKTLHLNSDHKQAKELLNRLMED